MLIYVTYVNIWITKYIIDNTKQIHSNNFEIPVAMNNCIWHVNASSLYNQGMF